MSVGVQESRLPRALVRKEIDNIIKTGVEIKLNSAIGKNGLTLDGLRQQGYQAIFMAVGTHRKRKLKIPGDEAATAAIGEVPDLSFLDENSFEMTPKNTIKVKTHTLETGVIGVFAGGDMVNGPTSVIQAIASGRKAALSIAKYLRGESLDEEAPVLNTIGIEDVDTAMFKKRDRQTMPKKEGYTEGAALIEADRCFQCGMFPKK